MTRDTKIRYVEQVRELLGSELSDEELDLLSADLEEQLADIDATHVEDRLGTPEEFVDVYRMSAGIEARRRLTRRPSEALERWLDSRRNAPLGRLWLRYQEAWWLLRGWVMVLAFGLVYSPQPKFKPFPIPNVNEYPTTSFAVLAGFTVGSLLLARTTKWPPGRVVNILVSAFAAYVAFVAAVNT